MPVSTGIPIGKKRYTLTLTENTMNNMQAYLSKNHAPRSMISTMIDEFLLDVLKTFDELEAAQQRQGGTITIGNLFQTIGNILSEKESDQKKLL